MKFNELSIDKKTVVTAVFYDFLQAQKCRFHKAITLDTVIRVFDFVNPVCKVHKNGLHVLDTNHNKGKDYENVMACCMETVNPKYNK